VSPWTLLIVVVCAGALYACWWGAGIILWPPKMSRNEVFPEQFGLRYEKVAFPTKDGLELKGWWLPSPNGPAETRTLLMCHGWGDNKGELLKFTHYLNEKAGFNLLYFDFRSHGESDGEMTTMGYFEMIDFAAAMDYLRKHRPASLARLGVFGLSMGASVSTLSIPSHPEIKAAVLESPFHDYRRVVRQWAWNHFKIPYIPLVWLTLLILKYRGVRDVDSYSAIKFVKKIAPRPLLIVGGSADALMPERDVRKLFGEALDPKQLWIIPGAMHAKCYEAGGLEYETRISGFFARNL
jgi:uncharacterized protein